VNEYTENDRRAKEPNNFLEWLSDRHGTGINVISECLELYFKRTKNRTHFQEFETIIQKQVQKIRKLSKE